MSNDNLYRFKKFDEKDKSTHPKQAGKYWIKYESAKGIKREGGSIFDGFHFPLHRYNIEWLEKIEADQQELFDDVVHEVLKFMDESDERDILQFVTELSSKYTLIPNTQSK